MVLKVLRIHIKMFILKAVLFKIQLWKIGRDIVVNHTVYTFERIHTI